MSDIALGILRRIAAEEPIYDSDFGDKTCCYCVVSVRDEAHEKDCPWMMAKKYVAACDGDESNEA